ncbi:MAG: hypothetical protein AB7N91_15670 [Candidatus Tectimicrobiota bacterium]
MTKLTMAHTPALPLWQTITLARQRFQLLNLDHPEVDRQIWRDLDAGVPVVYDRRWEVTGRLCRFLLSQPQYIAERSVLILGAGVGLETLVVGRLCRMLYINDLAPQALALCAQQLQHNGISHFTCLPGRFETLHLPPVDLVLGCYVVYNRDTAAAMRHFLARCPYPVLLSNDNLLNWQQLLRDIRRPYERLPLADEQPCVLFAALAPEPVSPPCSPAPSRVWLQSLRRPRKPAC